MLEAFEAKQNDWTELCNNLKAEEAFAECFLPVISKCYHEVFDYYKELSCVKRVLDVKNLKKIIFEHVVDDILPLINRTCIYELHEAKASGYLTEPSGKKRFRQFIKELSKKENFMSLMDKYPVLNSLINKQIQQYNCFFKEFLAHLQNEYAQLKEVFFFTSDYSLKELKRLGDKHSKSKTVMLVKFHNPQTNKERLIIYKPHSLSIDVAYNEFINWLNERSDFSYKLVKVINRGDHGWCEYIEYQSCNLICEIKKFYYRLGGMLAIAHLLNAGDLHFENLIAHGSCPVIIDYECLCQPVFEANKGKEIQKTRRTVLDTLILPNRISVDDEQDTFDLSAFSGDGDQFHPEESLVIENAGTDEVKVERRRGKFPKQRNIPKIERQNFNPKNFYNYFIKGFKLCYSLLIENKDLLLEQESSPLRVFSNVETRVLFKPTAEYSRLLNESFHPKLLFSQEEYKNHLDWLSDSRKQNINWDFPKVIEAEKADLLGLDIPFFTHQLDKQNILDSNRKSVDVPLKFTSYEALIQNAKSLGVKDLAFQENIIVQSFLCDQYDAKNKFKTKSKIYLDNPWEQKTEISNDSRKKYFLETLAEGILNKLFSLSSTDNSILYWSYPSPADSCKWSVNITNFDLYNGLLGIVLSSAVAYSVTKKTFYKETVDSFIKSLVIMTKNLNKDCSFGVFSGLGAFLFIIAQLNNFKFINNTLAGNLCSKITQHFEDSFKLDYPIFDVVDGSSGYLLALCVAHKHIDEGVFAKQADMCVKHLFSLYPKPEVMPKNRGNKSHSDQTILGVAHGLMGVVFALASYYKLSKNEIVLPWIREAVNLNNQSWNNPIKKWPDAIPIGKKMLLNNKCDYNYSGSFCYGQVGQSIVNLFLSENSIDDESSAKVLDNLHAIIDDGLSDIMNLCHGSLGTLDYLLLLEMRGLIPKGYVLNQFEKHLAPLLKDLSLLCTDHIGNAFIPGLMTGLSGVAYQLFRIANPQAIPSILSLGLI